MKLFYVPGTCALASWIALEWAGADYALELVDLHSEEYRKINPLDRVPVDYRTSFIGNKDQAQDSYQRMLAWQPKKVILAHGRWYQKNGTKELKRAFGWLE